MISITMSARQLDRFHIIKQLIDGHFNGTEVARLLRLSVRHIKRLKIAVREQGASGLLHSNKGRPSNRRIPPEERKKMIRLLKQRYADFKPTFATEKFSELHDINHDPKTIRKIMIEEGLWKSKVKNKISVHRIWRQRRSCYGEMVQFDGSYEHWLEDREQTGKMCLLVAIDDATGKIVKARFADHEGVFPVFGFWNEYIIKYGKPRSIYLDKFSTYNINHQLAKENDDTLTQFERACNELHIEPIKANSPQAKGRVERLFHTLQDRLIKEMRLKNISTVESANKFIENIFIPKFNTRFAVEPRNNANLHSLLNQKEIQQLPGIFSRQTIRTILNDFTFSFKNQWYQLIKEQTATVCKKDTVIVEERLDKTIHVRLRGKYLNYKLLPKRPEKQTISSKMPWILPATKTHIPPPNHPWRRPFLIQHNTIKNKQSMTFLFP